MVPILWKIFFDMIAPPSIVLAIYRYIPLGIQIQPWILTLVAFMSIPLTFTVRVQLNLFHQRREAASMGAVMLPIWKSYFPGGFDIVRILHDGLNNGYVGKIAVLHSMKSVSNPLQPKNLQNISLKQTIIHSICVFYGKIVSSLQSQNILR
jgi:hypothetical protein